MKSKQIIYTAPRGEYYNLYADATEQPHLLIAGATGSGKSVVINGIIHSLLYRFPGCQAGGVEFILIDPKRVELVQYAALPHTLYYASEPEQFVPALRYALRIIDARFSEMQRDGLRRFAGGDIYIIIDEFADLMTTQPREVKPLIQRIAQISRAAKVHIILATQTPIAKVIPTEIKCNFDARIGLRARSAQDSRNIIGRDGLEKLPRYGQGYYMQPGLEGFIPVPMVDESELYRLINHWMSQVKPDRKARKKARRAA